MEWTKLLLLKTGFSYRYKSLLTTSKLFGSDPIKQFGISSIDSTGACTDSSDFCNTKQLQVDTLKKQSSIRCG